MQQNNLWTSRYELGFHHKKKLCMYGLKIKRNRQKTAVVKTVLIIFLRNVCENAQLTTVLRSA